ncbi:MULTISPECIES: helix-turn-helix transcriptional regulator [unclassified Streptomyces]|uniref:helix-turn-helix domain-containing protein n=1 Tax=unclassified Streptomyces TaxID=2593676 RepID=UPI000DC372E4|nr:MULTISPECIES: helix-turn-helix transcriptional regulator [unclassified Streptomyces]RAJ77175.1 helix-turn-helix protein [Streptomyces sp. PsTaAH-137]
MTATGSSATRVALLMRDAGRLEAGRDSRRRGVQDVAPPRPSTLKFAELGSFLAARRAEVTPEQVGLPGGGSRRLTGLRREEVAMLAGIGASWYAWIEQGRAKNVSLEILEAIAHVLRLNEVECLHMMRLAGYAVPRRPRNPVDDDRRLAMRVVDSFLSKPAYFMDRYWDVLAANSLATRLLGFEGANHNYLESLFLDPRAPDRFADWERVADEAVARFRTQSGEYLGDPRLAALTQHLREGSAVFADLWERHRFGDGTQVTQVLTHPGLGQVSLSHICLDFAARPGLQLILLDPQSGAVADRLARWAQDAPLPEAGVRVPA